ncbi:MAG: SurA N-terminal domain-containing protein [Crocinitomicaceae bacterium]|nr:SurA N-terminal domain-containing protein [Crocinitomicaceae bacterium]
MAIIGKIRDKSWLILVIVGGALVAFILGDYNKGAAGVESKYGFGTVYGEKVDIAAFNDKVEIAGKNARQQAAQQGQEPQPVNETAIWKSYIQELVLAKEYEALGVMVSPTEFDAYLFGTDGFDVMPELAQGFTDSLTGQFNAKMLQTRIDQMESSEDANEQKLWEDSKEYYTNKRLKEKYFEILGQGLYVTKLEAKNEYIAQKETKSVSFVMKRYRDIKDDEINTSDEKLKAYFEEHKDEKKYENKFSTREVRFADVTIEPSKADSAEFNKTMNDLKSGLAATTNDSLYVLANSDVRYFVRQIGYRPEGDANAKTGFTYPKYMDTIFRAAEIGTVVGPYEENGATKIAKVIDKQGQLLTARHILISAKRGETEAVAKAKRKTDSIMARINTDNFEEFVLRDSEDPGSKNKGGKYEDFVDGEMVPEFSKFAMEKPIGEIGYVQTDFGFHIMEVLGRKDGAIPNLAIIQKTLIASQATIDDKEKEAYDLLEKIYSMLSAQSDQFKKVELFDTIVKQAGLFSRPANIQENNPQINGFTSNFTETAILKLAFKEDAQVGDIVEAPLRDKNRRVIAIVSSIKVKGEVHFEDVKPAVKADYIQDQKAKRLMEKMNGKSLNDLAKNGDRIQNAEVTFANARILNGYEPEIVGALFTGLKDGKMTQPIKGKQGVYVVRIDKTTKAPSAASYKTEKDQLLAQQKGKLQGQATNALIEKADVVDNRRFYEIGIRR